MYENPFHKTDISKFSFLVTGGAGFIGSNIVEYLSKYGAGKIKVLDNLSTGFMDNLKPYLNNTNFEFVEGDICDEETCVKACKNIDYVFHQAALGSVPRSIKNPIATNKSNIDGFVNMLFSAKESGVKRVVFASSSSVYGDSPILPKKEDQIGRPLSPYAVTKLVNELYCDVFSRTYGMEIIGLRYFNIFGPRQNPSGAYAAAIPLFIDALMKGESPFINGDGSQSRDFTFVENAVEANVKAMLADKKEALNQIFNIAVAEQTTINELFFILKEGSGSDVMPKYREERQGDVKHSLADITKARDLIDYDPKVKIKEGLNITLNWFKEYFY
jgi:UDP-N-acetylglucosamine 4-epimerase